VNRRIESHPTPPLASTAEVCRRKSGWQLVEQAAAFSGAGDEARNADRIAQQTEELEKLVKQRDALLKK
jgi:hypothetical protein